MEREHAHDHDHGGGGQQQIVVNAGAAAPAGPPPTANQRGMQIVASGVVMLFVLAAVNPALIGIAMLMIIVGSVVLCNDRNNLGEIPDSPLSLSWPEERPLSCVVSGAQRRKSRSTRWLNNSKGGKSFASADGASRLRLTGPPHRQLRLSIGESGHEGEDMRRRSGDAFVTRERDELRGPASVE